jgi:isoaspartyl peptidase/L-asparaginase-like protein (Ntn-hydrolase superfamily)
MTLHFSFFLSFLESERERETKRNDHVFHDPKEWRRAAERAESRESEKLARRRRRKRRGTVESCCAAGNGLIAVATTTHVSSSQMEELKYR